MPSPQGHVRAKRKVINKCDCHRFGRMSHDGRDRMKPERWNLQRFPRTSSLAAQAAFLGFPERHHFAEPLVFATLDIIMFVRMLTLRPLLDRELAPFAPKGTADQSRQTGDASSFTTALHGDARDRRDGCCAIAGTVGHDVGKVCVSSARHGRSAASQGWNIVN